MIIFHDELWYLIYMLNYKIYFCKIFINVSNIYRDLAVDASD